MISKNELDEFHHLYEHNLKDKATKMLRTKINVNDECFLDEHMKGNLLTYVLISDERSGLIYDWIDLLLDNGANIDLGQDNKQSVIHKALEGNNKMMFNYLMNKRVKLNLTELISVSPYFVDWLKEQRRLDWFYPWYDKFDWTHIDKTISEEIKKGYDIFKFKEKLEQELIETDKKIIKI